MGRPPRATIPSDGRGQHPYGDDMFDETAAAELAAQQHGLVTRSQLNDFGFTRGMLNRRFESGRWTPVGRTVVALGPIRQDLPARAMAAVLAVPHSVASHHTAGLLHQLPGLGITRPDERRLLQRPVDISTTGGSSSLRPGEVTVHRRTSRPRSLYLHGMRVTTIPQTLVDLAAVLDEAQLDRVLDMTLAQNRGALEALQALLASAPSQGVAGRAALQAIMAARHRPGGSASALERLFWEGINSSDVVLPARQVPMPWGATVDLLWAAQKLIGELDSRSWHERLRDRENDARRDAAALSHGYATLRMTWEMVADELDATLIRLAEALEQRSA